MLPCAWKPSLKARPWICCPMNERNPGLFHARLVHLANGDTLADKDCFIAHGFLIVSADAADGLPTWYNLSEVTALQEVEIEQKPKQQTQIRFF